jgi:hypothetical protein
VHVDFKEGFYRISHFVSSMGRGDIYVYEIIIGL